MATDRAEGEGSAASHAITTVSRWGALVLHVAIGVFPLTASALLAPPWALAVIAVAWLVGLVATWRIGTRRPRFAPLVPVVTLGAWFAFLTVGERLLGWMG